MWGIGGSHAGQYHRHSVDRDIKGFLGWTNLQKLIGALETRSIEYRDVGITAFLCAGRITETLRSQKGMFRIFNKFIVVDEFPLLKHWKKKDVTLICTRCGTENLKYEALCTSCNANLVFSARKKWETEKLDVKRNRFFIPRTNKLTDVLANRIEQSEDILFPSPYKRKGPYSRQWAYNIIKDFGDIVGLDGLYNHWFKAQRLMQLGNEDGFDEAELKAFSGIMKSETLSKYVKKIESYTKKMGLEIDPKLLQGE